MQLDLRRATLVVQTHNGAPRLACRHTEALAEGLTEVREVLEAPGVGNLRNRLARLGGIEEVAATAIQALVPDEIVNGAARGADRTMEAALRGIQVFGNTVERQVRIAQVIGDISPDTIAQCAASRLLRSPSHLLVDRQVDDLGDGFREHGGALRVD